MDILNFLKKYFPLINIIFISNFSNIIFFYLYLNVYFISYLYYNDKYFNYFIIKLILPFYSLGYLVGGFSVYFILNVLGYVKSIFFSVFMMGFIFLLQSFSITCISYLFYAFINGYFLAWLFVFLYNYCFTMYPGKIGLFSGILSSGFSISFIPINYLSYYIINKKNSKPSVLIHNFLIFKENEVENLPTFFKVYGLILMFISIILTLNLKNPEGIKSYWSKYLEKIIIFRASYHSIHSNNSRYIESNKQLKSNYFKSQSFIYNSIDKSFLLKEKFNLDKIEDEEIEKKIEKEIFFENLFSKKFILIFMLFINTEFIYNFYSVNLKIVGFKYYNEETVLKYAFIIFIFNFGIRILSGFSLQYLNFKNNLYLFNFIFTIGILFRFFTNSPIFSFFVSFIILLAGISLSITCFFICCRKIYGEGTLSISLNGIIQSCHFFGAVLEFIFEIIIINFGFNIAEFLVFIIIILNFILIFKIKI